MSSHMAFPPQAQRTAPADLAIGLAAFAAAVVLLRLPFGRLNHVVATVTRRCRRAATSAEATRSSGVSTPEATAARWRSRQNREPAGNPTPYIGR
ncbi:MAG: hypothetical protein ACRDR6_03410 [Pseudonocardiaceae bacterium]